MLTSEKTWPMVLVQQAGAVMENISILFQEIL
jgi:hypothetical protein